MAEIAVLIIIAVGAFYLIRGERRRKTWVAGLRSEIESDIAREEAVVEAAPWFGRTGLPEETERELPKYVRRELGQSFYAEGSLKAGDLEYLGTYPWESHTVHYWKTRMPGESEDSFATVLVHDGVPNLDWGCPPPETQGGKRSYG